MAGQITTVFSIFRNPSKASKAVGRLTSAGFSNFEVFLLKSTIDGQLSSMGIPEIQAKRYEEYLKAGCVFLAVRCSNSLEIDRANTILEQNGAQAISCIEEPAFSTPGANRP